MPRLASDIRSLVAYLLQRGARHENDRSATAELNWSHTDLALPPGLELQWLGTSGFRLAYQGHQLLIDPYVSRIPVADLLRRRRVTPSAELVEQHVPSRSDAIVIGHTHFDHAIDAPVIAARDRCRVYGSRSMANLMALYGVGELAVEVAPYAIYEVGPFEISFVPSLHSKLVLGAWVPYEGVLTCEHLDDLTPQAYCCGRVFGIHIAVAGVTFYHQGSCDLIEDAIRHKHIDFFLAGIAGRRYTKDYTRRICAALEPRVVIPNHYDNFFRPLDAEMDFSFNVNFGGFVDELAETSREFRVASLEPMQSVRGG